MSSLRTFSFPNENGVIEQYEIYSNIASEGTSLNIKVTTPGWTRILTTINSSSGHLDVNIRDINLKTYQNIGFEYSGYTGNKNSNAEPLVYQTHNNVFGQDVANNPKDRVLITKARLAYSENLSHFEIYIDFEPDKIIELRANYSGKYYENYIDNSQNLWYYNIPLKNNHGLNVQNGINYFKDSYSNKSYASNLILKNQNIKDINKLKDLSGNLPKMSKRLDKTKFNTITIDNSINGYFFAYPVVENYLYSIFQPGYTSTIGDSVKVTFNEDEYGYGFGFESSVKYDENLELIIINPSLPIYLPPLGKGKSYYLQDCGVHYIEEETTDSYDYENYSDSPIEIGGGGGYIVNAWIKPNNSAKKFYPAISIHTTYQKGIALADPPLFYHVDNEELTKLTLIDFNNFNFVSDDGILPYSLIHEISHKTLENIVYYYGYYQDAEDFQLVSLSYVNSYAYDIELNLVDILTRLYELELRPRIYTGSSSPNEGRVGDVWIETIAQDDEEA